MPDPIIDNRLFTDGTTGDVYIGADGRKYVLGDDGDPANSAPSAEESW